jgi:pimeloyl-ACP methyl ester carboxylesterase
MNRQAGPAFVLVHGAWHGAWCWDRVADILRDAGRQVFTPCLTGLGERAHLADPSIGLSTHVADVIDVIQDEGLTDVILVGHSYAGHVVALVADRLKPKIRHLVMIDSKLPHDGQPFYSGPGSEERTRQAYASAIDGYLMTPMPVSWLGLDPDSQLGREVAAKLTPQPMGTLLEPVVYKNGGIDSLPKTYIRTLKRANADGPDPIADEIKDKPGWIWKTIDTGHDAMLLESEILSEMLLAAG